MIAARDQLLKAINDVENKLSMRAWVHPGNSEIGIILSGIFLKRFPQSR